MNYVEMLKLAAPETLLVLAALLVIVSDFSMRGLDGRARRGVGGMIACVGCVAAGAWLLVFPAASDALGGMLIVDPLTRWVKVALVGLTAFTVLLFVDSDFTDHAGEYLSLTLLATVGMMFLVSAGDVLMIFIALELTSLSLYILTAFNKRDRKSAEAALKYFLFGGMSAAFTLFGLSLLYGFSGSTDLQEIAAALSGRTSDPLLGVAIVMVVIGLGFKVAAAPFHLWAPDAYQGAPVPSAALIASGSKVAGFFLLARVMSVGFAGAEGSGGWHAFASGWVPLIAIMSAVSMVLGNLAAIVQVSVRRLLAYSAIGHAGYMLIAVMSHSQQSLASLLYYSVTYGLTTIGAFAAVSVVERGGGSDSLDDFAGLSRRAPVASFCLMVFLLSLAGIPPLAGFFGKFFVFAAALNTGAPNLGLLWLVILAVAMSAVSLYYYLQVLKRVFVSDPPAAAARIRVPLLQQVVLCILAAGVVALGAMPTFLLNCLDRAVAGGH